MELILSPSRMKKIRYQFIFYITLISFLISIVHIQHHYYLHRLFFMCALCVGISLL